MASRSLSDLRPEFLPKANAFLYGLIESGIDHVVTCTLRSMAEQKATYAQGRTTPGPIVTDAKPGESPHNFGLGMDVYPLLNGKLCTTSRDGDEVSDPIWQKFGSIARACGLVWGGEFKNKDGPHVELPDWKRIARQAP